MIVSSALSSSTMPQGTYFSLHHIMITGLVVTPGETAARISTDVHRRFTIDAQAFDAA